jgi:hypothetical protein
LGLGAGLCGSVFYFSSYFVASALALIGFVGWFWPRKPREIER